MTTYVFGRRNPDDPTPVIYFPKPDGPSGEVQLLDYILETTGNPFVSNQSALG